MASYAFGRAIKQVGPGGLLRVLLPCLLFVATAGYMCKTCYYDSYDLNLNLGKTALVEMMEPKHLEAAGFYELYADPTPSDFVEFINSKEGQKLWPVTTAEWRASFDHPKAVESPERNLLPERTDFHAHEPDPSDHRQIVYIPLDDTGQIELVGYLDPDEKPVYEWTVPFPAY